MSRLLLQGQTAADVLALVLTGLLVVLGTLGLLIWLVSLSSRLCRAKPPTTMDPPSLTEAPQPIQQAPHSNSFAAEETALAAAIGAALAIVLEPEPTKTPALPTDGKEQPAAFHSNWTAVSIQEQTHPFLPHPERRSS